MRQSDVPVFAAALEVAMARRVRHGSRGLQDLRQDATVDGGIVVAEPDETNV